MEWKKHKKFYGIWVSIFIFVFARTLFPGCGKRNLCENKYFKGLPGKSKHVKEMQTALARY